ncbi:hypothetical protein VNO77_15131 [Canavalia gladiata]|uniref:Uncharacterized protein n=1 Tax=Canavalia gladiata TaxID=3824 RepID=A0AAN9LZZ4_CANGL
MCMLQRRTFSACGRRSMQSDQVVMDACALSFSSIRGQQQTDGNVQLHLIPPMTAIHHEFLFVAIRRKEKSGNKLMCQPDSVQVNVYSESKFLFSKGVRVLISTQNQLDST